MASVQNWWRAHRPTDRRLMQLYSALLYNAYLKGFLRGEIYTGGSKMLCVPGLNCYSCPGAVGACPLGALQNALASSGTRAGTYVLGILLLYAVTLGRTICGWLCPFGLLQELLHKLPTPKVKKSRWTRGLSYLKYVLLAAFAIALPLYYGLAKGMPLPAFCKYICPAGTLEGAAALLAHPGNAGLFALLGSAFIRKLVILVAVLIGCVFCYRAFCRFLCPLGAIYGLFHRIAPLGVKVDKTACNGCGACVAACPMDVRRVGDRECIHCGKCASACWRGAISFRPGKRVMKAVRAILLCAAVAVLVAVNIPSSEPAVSSGNQAGEQLPDFAVECLDGTTFALSDARGKVTFINLWATWCAPCVRELTYFDDLLREHPDDVAVLAAHSSLVTEDVRAYLEDKGWTLPFAIDTDDSLYALVGGTNILPQTIVLDRNGVVIYNEAGSMTPEALAELYEEASNG